MAAKKCLICSSAFSGRRDARTCSARCRKHLQMVRSTVAESRPAEHPFKGRTLKKAVAVVAFGVLGLLGLFLSGGPPVQAATSSYFNFQMRLLSSSGAVVADGNYHVEFKLYNAANSTGSTQGSCSGDSNCLWVEIRTTGNLVRVVNGYFSVQLGSVTALPDIDWNQELWLGVRIGGNGGSVSWETIELTSDGTATGNKIALTAVPYAFTARELQMTSGSFTNTLLFATPSGSSKTLTLPNETGTVCTTGSVCTGYQAASSSTLQNAYNSDADGSDAIIALTTADDGIILRNPDSGGSDSTYILTLDQLEDDTGTLGGLSIQSAGTGNLLLITDTTATAADVLTIANGGAATFRNQTDSTTAFQIQNAAGSTVLRADTSNADYAAVILGGTGYNYSELGLNQGSSKLWGIGTDDGGLGGVNGFYIYNIASANYTFGLSTNGAATFRNTANSTTAFQIQNAAGTGLLTVDTSNLKTTNVGDLNVGNRYGNRLFSDSFESGTFGLWTSTGGAGTGTIDSAVQHDGKYSFKGVISSNDAWALTTLASHNTVYARAWVNITSQGAASLLDMLELTNTAGSSINSLYRNNSSNQLCVWNSVVGASAGCGGSWSGSGWHLVELRTTVDTTSTGVIQAWLDGTLVVNLTAQNNGTTAIGRMIVGEGNNRTATYYIDDVSADTVTNGTASSASIDDSLHVGGTSSFGNNVLIQTTSDSTKAFQVQNAAGNNYIQVDSSGANLHLGNGGIASTIQIGNTTGAVAQTTNIGTNATASSTSTVNIGSTVAGVTTVQGSGVIIKGPTSSTTAVQIQGAGGAKFFILDSTNSRIQIGDTTADGTGVILVLDTKNTSGDPTGVNGGMYYNSDTAKFRCYEASIWWDCLSPSPDRERRMPFYSTDFFMGNEIVDPWKLLGVNSGTSSSGTGAASHPGLSRFRSSTSADSGHQITFDSNVLLLAGGEVTEFNFLLDSLTSNTFRLGFLDTQTVTDATDGAYIEIPSTGAATCKTANNGTRTTSATIATLSLTTWYRARVTVHAAATSVTCEIFNDSGTSLGSQSNSANIPTGAGRQTANKVIATNSGTTATDLLSLDYMALWWDRILTR